jgi:PhnB protein
MWPGGGMAWMEVGDGLLHITTPDPSWGPDSGSSTSGFVLKVYVDDVDTHFVHAKSQGATIVSEPEDSFWGGRIYRVRDHEGHGWEIAQRGRDLAEHLWVLPPGVTRGVNL